MNNKTFFNDFFLPDCMQEVGVFSRKLGETMC